MYAPVPGGGSSAAPHEAAGAASAAAKRWIWNILLLGLLTGALALAYERCVTCVLGIAVLSILLMNCVPGMPIVFLLSVAVLLYHAVDYQKATVKVGVNLHHTQQRGLTPRAAGRDPARRPGLHPDHGRRAALRASAGSGPADARSTHTLSLIHI